MRRVLSAKQFKKVEVRSNSDGIKIGYGVTESGGLEVAWIEFPEGMNNEDQNTYLEKWGLLSCSVSLRSSGGFSLAQGTTLESAGVFVEDDGSFYLDIYANTTDVLFSHGFKAAQGMKYDLSQAMINAPVMMDHGRSIAEIMGWFEPLGQDESGLKLRLHFRNPNSVSQAGLKDSLVAVRDGYARAFSISGNFTWASDDYDSDDYWIATKATIHEVSVVWRGSDPLAVPMAHSPEGETKEEATGDSETFTYSLFIQNKIKGAKE